MIEHYTGCEVENSLICNDAREKYYKANKKPILIRCDINMANSDGE